MTKIIREILDLPYRGARDYAHGTDLYLAVAGVVRAFGLSSVSEFKLSFHGLLKMQGLMTVHEEGMTRRGRALVDFSFQADRRRYAGIVEETTNPIARRVQWDEASIERECRFQENAVLYAGSSDQSPIEVLVASTKALHYRIFPASGRRWMFSRIELDRLLDAGDVEHLSVTCVHNFNNRITKSEVRSQGKGLGHIYFSTMPAS